MTIADLKTRRSAEVDVSFACTSHRWPLNPRQPRTLKSAAKPEIIKLMQYHNMQMCPGRVPIRDSQQRCVNPLDWEILHIYSSSNCGRKSFCHWWQWGQWPASSSSSWRCLSLSTSSSLSLALLPTSPVQQTVRGVVMVFGGSSSPLVP